MLVYPYREQEYFNVKNNVESFRKSLDTLRGVVSHGITIKNGYYQLMIDIEDASVASLIPKIINGIETIVTVTGRVIYAKAVANSNYSIPNSIQPMLPILPDFRCGTVYNPIVTGICINGERSQSCYAGTLGAFVDKGGQLVGLTNNHVIAEENLGKIGDPVYHPPQRNTCGATAKIGTIGGYELTKFNSGDNYIDAAWFYIDSGISYNNSTRCTANNYSIIGPAIKGSELALNTPVKKCGARTAYTEGSITSIDIVTNINTTQGNAHYVDQIRMDGIDGMMGGGDSGSIWVRQSDNRPIALNFAGPASAPYNYAIGNKLERVENILGISFGRGTGGGGNWLDQTTCFGTYCYQNKYLILGGLIFLLILKK